MAEVDLVEAVEETQSVDPEAFERRVHEEADALKAAIQEGSFNNPQASIGLEYEFYGVAEPAAASGRTPASEGGRLMRLPRRVLDMIGFEKELGLHNAEMTTNPQPLNRYGIAAQEAEVTGRLKAALDATQTEGIRLVSDGLWTIPPEGETAEEYLTASATEAGVTVATNMSDSVRYHAMANSDAANVGMLLEAPHVRLASETVMPESLATSIQPHYQVPQAEDLPEYFRYALRIAGPMLALCANSPFFPPDLYDDGTTVEDAVADGWQEHRISVFETVLNTRTEPAGKVRFPTDLESVEAAVDRVADDELLVPMAVEEQARFDDRFAHFLHQHGSYWRWVRPVFDGPTESAANARVEFRPIAAQPTVQDAMAVQVAFAGLMSELPQAEHPVAELEWEAARDNFYAAMRDGLDADLVWITATGHRTRTPGEIFGDLLARAEAGLQSSGLTQRQVDEHLRPLRARLDAGTTPAGWKQARAREAAAEGADLAAAIETAQREYLEYQWRTLLEGSFADWIDG